MYILEYIFIYSLTLIYKYIFYLQPTSHMRLHSIQMCWKLRFTFRGYRVSVCLCVVVWLGWNDSWDRANIGAAFWGYPGAFLLCLGWLWVPMWVPMWVPVWITMWITMWITSAELWITFDVISAVFIEERADFIDWN